MAANPVARPRVAIVARDRAYDGLRNEFETQLRSELLASGFEVITLTDPQPTSPAALEVIADRTQSLAAISLVEATNAAPADIWVSDRVTGKTLYRHIRAVEMSGQSASIFAIRAVELLRASLLELHDAHATRGNRAAPPAVREWARPRGEHDEHGKPSEVERWEIQVGGGVWVANVDSGAPSVPVGLAPSLALGRRLGPSWTLQLAAMGPAIGPVSTPSANLSVDQEIVTLRLRFEPILLEGPCVPHIAVGAGGYHLGARASGASSQFDVFSRTAWGGAITVGVGARLQAGRSLGFVAGVEAVWVTPRPVLTFADGGRAPLASPGLLGTLAVVVPF